MPAIHPVSPGPLRHHCRHHGYPRPRPGTRPALVRPTLCGTAVPAAPPPSFGPHVPADPGVLGPLQEYPDPPLHPPVPGGHERSPGGRPGGLPALQRLLHPPPGAPGPAPGSGSGRPAVPGGRRPQPGRGDPSRTHLPGQGPGLRAGGTARRGNLLGGTLQRRPVRHHLSVPPGLPPGTHARSSPATNGWCACSTPPPGPWR
jgi:hypothetical protein